MLWNDFRNIRAKNSCEKYPSKYSSTTKQQLKWYWALLVLLMVRWTSRGRRNIRENVFKNTRVRNTCRNTRFECFHKSAGDSYKSFIVSCSNNPTFFEKRSLKYSLNLSSKYSLHYARKPQQLYINPSKSSSELFRGKKRGLPSRQNFAEWVNGMIPLSQKRKCTIIERIRNNSNRKYASNTKLFFAYWTSD